MRMANQANETSQNRKNFKKTLLDSLSSKNLCSQLGNQEWSLGPHDQFS